MRTGPPRGGLRKRGSASPAASPSTTRLPASACAKSSSLLRRERSHWANSSGRSVSSAATDPGEKRSGSGKKRSRPIAAGFASEIRPMSSATRVRGHGHWPWRASEPSSITTMVTGCEIRSRGKSRWYPSKIAWRRACTGGGDWNNSSARAVSSIRASTRTPPSALRDRSPCRRTPPKPSGRGRHA